MKNKKFTVILAACAVILVALLAAVFYLFREPGAQPSPSTSKQALRVTTPTVSRSAQPTEPKDKVILPNFSEAHEKNSDMVGWIKLPGSRVDYPVMYTPQDKDFYLRRNFDKQEDIYGVPYIDARCSLDGDNYLIYGHETDNGSEFHDFSQYQKKDFWEKNKTIEYSDLYHNYKYELVAFFRGTIHYSYEKVFKFYQFTGSTDEASFDNYIQNVKQRQFYDTGVTPKYGDHLLSLVMCMTPYSKDDDDRFVLVFRRVGEIEK